MFEAIRQPNLLKEIFRQIKENVRGGKLTKGTALPSEREWAATLGVSRTTLREAIKAMELVGLLDCVQGSGNYIPDNLSHALSEPVSVMFMLEGGTAAHILEFRQAVEITSARRAAQGITAERLDELEAIAAEMARESDPDRLARLDQRFHMLIVEQTGNPLIISMMNAAESLIQEQIHSARELLMQDSQALCKIQEQHLSLIAALRENNPRAATGAIIEHLDFVSDFMLDRRSAP